LGQDQTQRNIKTGASGSYTPRPPPEIRLEHRRPGITQSHLEHPPDDPFILFNLGAIAVERQEWREALAFLERSLARSAPTDSIVRKLFALIARAHQMLGDSRAALETGRDGGQTK
jgi:uncharacterized protein HemY